MRNRFYIILCLFPVIAGCTSYEKYGQPVTALGGRDVSSANNAHSQPAEQSEDLKQTVAPPKDDRETRVVPAAHHPVPATDPGAVWLVGKLREVIQSQAGQSDDARGGEVWIGTRLLRNQSRAQNDEFDAMVVRLAGLLDAAGFDEKLRFTADAAQPVDFQLKGAAYIVTTEGFDLWELYLSLKPEGRAWTLWQADAPVRLLRSERLRGQQLFPPTGVSR